MNNLSYLRSNLAAEKPWQFNTTQTLCQKRTFKVIRSLVYCPNTLNIKSLISWDFASAQDPTLLARLKCYDRRLRYETLNYKITDRFEYSNLISLLLNLHSALNQFFTLVRQKEAGLRYRIHEHFKRKVK